MVTLKKLTYQGFRGQSREIDFSDGTTVISSRNGGGKTTLAKVIMGLVRPTSGQILWNGRDITHLSITERARLGISYGFQQPPRFKGMRIRDMLGLAAGNRNLTRDECCSYLNRVGLCAAQQALTIARIILQMESEA